LQLAAVVVGHIGRRDAGDLGDDLLDLGLGDGLLALARRQDALGGAGLVDHVDGLVGQVAVVDVLGAQLGRSLQAATAYFTLWCSSKRLLRPLRISTVSSTVGSTTSTFWKRRDRAASFSKMPRYSVNVVAPMHLSWPNWTARA
jgi:hypothetical protein